MRLLLREQSDLGSYFFNIGSKVYKQMRKRANFVVYGGKGLNNVIFFTVDDLKPKESKLKGVKTMPNFQNINAAEPKIHQSATQSTSLKRNESSGNDLGMHKDSSSMKVSRLLSCWCDLSCIT